MVGWFKQLDELLRGKTTSPEMLIEGHVQLPARRFVILAIALGATFGFFMGWFAFMRGGEDRVWQAIASMVKLPALFLLTLVVTFPSLYVFNALVGCRLTFTSTLRLLIGAILVNVTVAASLGPILGFFTLSTTSYPFMILLNVILLAIAGFVALAFMLHTLRRLALPRWHEIRAQLEQTAEDGEEANASTPGPLDAVPDSYGNPQLGEARTIFRIWILIYGLVGAQMGWLLRPFIGDPNAPFEWFRNREGNFFSALTNVVKTLVGAE